MATLKKGSKGKPVEELQTLVNANGIKPPLKVDGVFGPLTEKGVRAAQKKLKIAKTDGVAGEESLAALRYGRPLPVMKAPVYSGEVKKCTSLQKNTDKQEDLYAAINKQVDAMNKAIDDIVSDIRLLRIETGADLQTVILSGTDVAVQHKLFEMDRLSRPERAERAAEDAHKSFLEAEAAKKKISDRLSKAGPLIAKNRKAAVAAYAAAEKHLVELEKAVAEGQKKLTALAA